MLPILRGEYQIAGFTNRALQRHLAGWNPQKIGRVLKRFRVLRLIKRVGRTYKYYLSSLGKKVLVATLQLKLMSDNYNTHLTTIKIPEIKNLKKW